MPKTMPFSLRLQPEIKEALEKAAREDERSASIFAERILKSWLAEHGHLQPPASDR
jgi:hypothetical protein